MFQEVDSRELQGYLKEVQRMFQGTFGCFKNVSMKFCFAILLLHGSNSSYPSIRRACSGYIQLQCQIVQLGPNLPMVALTRNHNARFRE